MSAWLFLAEQQISWPKIVEAYSFLGGLNITLFVIGCMAFQTRDFKT